MSDTAVSITASCCSLFETERNICKSFLIVMLKRTECSNQRAGGVGGLTPPSGRITGGEAAGLHKQAQAGRWECERGGQVHALSLVSSEE